MSDGLTPAEQARAARWAKDWLSDAGFDVSETARDAMSALSCHADKLDPPETVESLRAERDEAWAQFKRTDQLVFEVSGKLDKMRAERDKALRANERFAGEQEELVQALNKLSAANYTIARLRSTHTQAEAARGRCSRED